eukprot:TRINITY_DN5406_c0_g2_i1.p2 TRINITY_DN5406_c0_g2~~TRINITY_DN5406_c0_g2_i1.p2  ORF type:complete len:176 (-),score=57.84 TRINITY_DN5406_c0_g2_i1:38-565(-)
MSYLAAQLLLFLEEEEAFWMLVKIMKDHSLQGFFIEGVPLLKLCLYCLDRLIEIQLPHLFSHFKSCGVTPLLFASQWFPTVYTYNIPLGVSVHIWDVFFVEGLQWLFKVALAILRLNQDQLLTMDFEAVVEHLKSVVRRLDPGMLIKVADTMDMVTPQRLVELKQEFKHPKTDSL